MIQFVLPMFLLLLVIMFLTLLMMMLRCLCVSRNNIALLIILMHPICRLTQLMFLLYFVYLPLLHDQESLIQGQHDRKPDNQGSTHV